jgi:PQQ-dependent dehydrogenase (methanol/ethanol family)
MKNSIPRLLIVILGLVAFIPAIEQAQTSSFVPVTDEVLKNPSPNDWLMFSRTYDAQRFSPLSQINKQNVGQLRLAWKLDMGTGGSQESIPLVYRGVMYSFVPPATIQALDAASGNLLWEYKRQGQSKTKGLAIYEDLLYFTTPDGSIVALDVRDGKVRWETKVGQAPGTSGPIVVEGKVITGRACARTRDSCFIAAHDAKTGKELWKFYTVPAKGEPGWESWGPDGPEDNMMASTWGMMGSYDPVRKLVLWGVANPMPNTRMARHKGNADAVSRTAPSDLYSNSTVALDPVTGKLAWYFQHLPGDDWDQDYTNERILIRTSVSPDPRTVKWINPDVPRGQQRNISVNVGEGGGLFALDRDNGQFLWATPFPYDAPQFLISGIDGKTGKSTINWDVVLKEPGEQHVICAYNTKSYWPMSYHPGKNAMYIPYVDNCLDMAAAAPAVDGKPATGERRTATRRPGSDPNKFGGLAKVNMSTGEIQRLYEGPAPGIAATLATAGDVVFWGTIDRKFRAFDADSGKILWETAMDSPVSNSTITYSVNGKQYVAVFTGNGGLMAGLLRQAGLEATPVRNGLYVFSLP